MKKAMIIALAAILLFPTACSKKEKVDFSSSITSSNKKENSTVPSQEEEGKKISFETVDREQVPKTLMDRINILKKKRGFIYYKDDSSGYIYIAALMGERPTGGYVISVNNVEEYQDKIKVKVEERLPDKNQMVTMALTQPYTVVRIKSSKANIVVENQNGMKLEEIINDQ